LPTLASVRAVEQPMVMTRVDFHAVWVNAAALSRAGLTRNTPDPVGGRIVRDASGEPTGVLVDAACALVTKHIPLERTETLEQDVRRALQRCARAGLTCVHDMMMTPEVLRILRGLEAAGDLTLRVRAYMHGAQPEIEEALREPQSSDRLRVMGRKLFADGALGSRGAALRAPYSDDPSTSGLLMMSEEELVAAAARTHALGGQVAIHAIGDRAAELAASAIIRAQGSPVDRRHRVEHAQTVTPALFPAFAKAGIIASMQPSHCTCDLGWAVARLGQERIKGAYAWRSFLEAGVRLALGSDAPIASENPWDGVRSAVARTDAHGATITPEQRLTLDEALTGYTSGAAFAAHDANLGRLAPGSLADFVVIDRDPFATDVEELASVRTLRTVVGGVTVFEQDA
jgi:predicted amidohydrolase YtcJ